MNAMPFIGELRERLTLESVIEVPDDNGGVTRSFVAGPQFYAQTRVLRSRFRLAGPFGDGVITHQVVMRWRDDLTAEMRLRRGARVLRIVALEYFDPKARFVRAHCEEMSL